jgi:hypothetical protein
MLLKTFPFLYATRFWAMVIAAASVYAQAKGWIAQPEMLLIATITAGFTVVRTIDRATEQPILAAAVATGQVKAATVLDIPPLPSDSLTAPPGAGGAGPARET